MPLFFQVALYFDGGFASLPGGGNRLPVRPVLNIARMKDARDIGARIPM
ncbi:MAG: hypothetical protein JOZ32_01950 [Bryobacterales bacterium]|nr:hypothetical protein [Bryobacterales bacterium]